MTENRRKTLILGLDGATWRLFRPLIDEGKLPNIASLLASGASGVLHSSIPPLTAPAWTNFQTGANAGKHGVFDFRIFDRTSRTLKLVNSREICMPTLWQIASAAGYRVVTVNVPMTFPPQPVNGLVIGGMLAQNVDSSLVYPPERFQEIMGRHPDYRVSPPVVSQRGVMGRRAYIAANIQVEARRCDLALDLIRNEPWDLFMVQNQCLDYIQHSYFHLMDPSAAEFDPQGYEEVLGFYRAMDENVGRLVEAAPPNTDVILVSDHGFKIQHRLIHLAPWLRAQGYLVEDIDARQRLLQALRKADIFKLRRHFAHWVLRGKQARFSAAASNALGRIDWQRSRAYMAIGSVFGCIYINRQNDRDMEGLLSEITEKLSALIDPKTGRKVVTRILRGQEIYHGPLAENGPDLIIEPAEDYAFGAPSLVAHQSPFTDIDFELEIPGGHHPDGILIWSGGNILPKHNLEANLMDIAPTILGRLGIPVPEHMDGRVLVDLFSPPLSFEQQKWNLGDAGEPGAGYSAEDESALQKRLHDLGYL